MENGKNVGMELVYARRELQTALELNRNLNAENISQAVYEIEVARDRLNEILVYLKTI